MLRNAFENLATESTLNDIKTAAEIIAAKPNAPSTVELGASTLSALENVVVSGTVSVSNLPSTQPVSATSLPLPSGAATESTLSSVNTSLGTDGSSPPVISGTGVRGWLRAIYERLTSGIGRTWNLSNASDSVAVTGTVGINNFPVSTALTNTELRASAVGVTVSNFPSGGSTETTLVQLKSVADSINTAASAIKSAVEALNTKTTTADTSNIAGTVQVGNFPAVQSVSDSALSTVAQNDVVVALKEIQDTLLFIASAQFEKMPRVTANDQVAVAIESGSVGIASNQTLATVTTVNTVGNINTTGSKYISGDNLNLVGCAHLYNNIIVS